MTRNLSRLVIIAVDSEEMVSGKDSRDLHEIEGQLYLIKKEGRGWKGRGYDPHVIARAIKLFKWNTTISPVMIEVGYDFSRKLSP